MHQALDYMDFDSGFQAKGSKFRIKTTAYSCPNSSCRNTWGSVFSTSQGYLVRHQHRGVSNSTDVTKVKPVFASLREHASKAMLMCLDLGFGQFRCSLVLRHLYYEAACFNTTV